MNSNKKFDELNKYLTNLNEQGICLAFSGGIDSTLLLYLCKNLNILAVTFNSILQTDEELDLTKDLCKKYGVNQKIITLNPLENEYLVQNPKDRCYVCKKMFFTEIKKAAEENNLLNIIDGTNFDDLHTFRPGLKALEELGVISPLAKFEITKSEIREYAKNCGIEIYDKPSTPCLATRFPYDTILEPEMINKTKKAEKILHNYGFTEVRARQNGCVTRIELPKEDFEKFLTKKETITKELKSLGLKYITLDLEGLRSMD